MIQKTSIAVLLLISIHSFAQLNKNRVMISGRGNVYTDKTVDNHISGSTYDTYNTEKNFNGNVYLNAGYFLSNNFAIGGIVGFGKNTYNRDYTYLVTDHVFQETISKSYTTGIFARYNHMIRQSKFGLFFELDNTYSWGNLDDKSTTYSNNTAPNIKKSKEKSNTFKVGLIPGLMYFVTNRLSIETSIGDISYSSVVTKDQLQQSNVLKNNQFNADFSMATVYFGLTFYLGGSKTEATKNENESK